jgi:hypothetical protein
MKRVALTFCAAICVASAPAQSQDQTAIQAPENSQVAVAGSGIYSCAKFLSVVGEHKLQNVSSLNGIDGNRYYSENAAYLDWIKGFISAINILHPSLKISIDNYAAELWIRNWCGKHPTEMLFKAADQLVHTHAVPK